MSRIRLLHGVVVKEGSISIPEGLILRGLEYFL